MISASPNDLPIKEAIETINFSPSEDFLRVAEGMLRQVFWEAPSDSVLRLRFRKEEDGFMGLLQIRGLQKNFLAKVSSHSLQKIPEILHKKMSSQLMEWKKNRNFH